MHSRRYPAALLAIAGVLAAGVVAASAGVDGREELYTYSVEQIGPGAAQVVAPGGKQTMSEQLKPGETTLASEEQNVDPTRPQINPDVSPPAVSYDLERLPAAVKRMHDMLISAARTGDLEKLRPLIGAGSDATQLSLDQIPGDPIEYLRGASGDAQGQEILAILDIILSAGYVHMGEGTDQELYVWPYFYAYPLDTLDAHQREELFKIVTSGDYEGMKEANAYTFYRAGITPGGRWAFFVAGD